MADLTGLKSFGDYLGRKHEAIVGYLGTVAKKVGGVHVLPWEQVIKELG